jgi:hypothetical protein
MLFHEIYGCYYNAVTEILSLAVKGELTDDEMRRIVQERTFAESFLTILPALKHQKWQLMDTSFHTPLHREPVLPLSTLQKRWLKALTLDPRVKLFSVNTDFLEGVPPLFTPDDFTIFDQYTDGDSYENENYIRIFHTVLTAVQTHQKIWVQYESRKGNRRTIVCSPYQIEYSEKDDKFRVFVAGCRFADVLNIGRIKDCRLTKWSASADIENRKHILQSFLMEITDERNALERVMLHFAHFKKEAEQISKQKYKIKVYYTKEHSCNSEK